MNPPPDDALRIDANGVRAFAGILLLAAGIIALYVWQFEDTNAYTGIRPLRETGTLGYWVLLLAWLLSVGALLPSRVRTPSDVFLAIYLVGSTVWSAAYWPATGLIGMGGAVVLWAILLAPAAAILWVRRLMAGRQLPEIPEALRMRQDLLVPVVAGLVALAAVMAYGVGGSAVGFDYDLAHERRLTGRESFAGSVFTSYLLQMATNGLAPFLAFLGARRRSVGLVVAALAFAVFGFWMFGLKSTFLSVALLAVLGWLVSRGRVAWFPEVLIGGLVLVLCVALVERSLNEVSLVAEFGIRRAVLVASVIQVYFVDALLGGSGGAGWALLRGIDSRGFATPEYFIGSRYFGNEQTNANGSAYLHQMAAGGIAGYLAVVIGVAVLLAVLDLWHRKTSRTDGFAIGAILGILLLEQAFTTALVSSGVVLCILLAVTFTEGPEAGAQREVLDPQ